MFIAAAGLIGRTDTAALGDAMIAEKDVAKILMEIERDTQLWPSCVEKITHKFGIDSAGDDAIWIFFSLAKDSTRGSTRDIARELNSFDDTIKELVFNTGTNAWPYCRVLAN